MFRVQSLIKVPWIEQYFEQGYYSIYAMKYPSFH